LYQKDADEDDWTAIYQDSDANILFDTACWYNLEFTIPHKKGW